MTLFDIVTRATQLLGNRFTNEDKNSINKYRSEWSRISDEELRQKLRAATEGIDQSKPRVNKGVLSWLSYFLPQFLHRKNPTTLNNIALAVEAFNRAPADLPPGSRLFPGQVQAAITLTRRCLIQMDTGEGKTYALLPAAFALACEHQRVYILCANEYLAWRDANRTRSFWEFVGLPPGLCIEGTPDHNWLHRVVYTTLEKLVFRHLQNTISKHTPDFPLLFGSVLLDEADAILLDQGTSPYTLIQEISSAAFDWSFARQYADTLVEEQDIVTDLATLHASLTVAGEQKLRERLATGTAGGPSFLMTRYAVELAYVALKVVEEGRDYVVEDKVYAIDRVTGKVQRNVTPHWIIPLEFMRGLKSSPERITLDSISPVTVLKKFRHMAGMSGTIADDALEYLFTYFLPTQVIPPRKKRFQGLLPDLIFMSKKDSSKELCLAALEQVEMGRPVLIGTQTIVDAEYLHREIAKQAPPHINVRLLTGKNDRQAAEIFARGGEVGSLIISTQLAGRGVDIRLDPNAKSAGGLVLLSLGRSLTLRYDKQFTGRAGRQGDPFQAQFYCSYDDELLRRLIGETAKRLMEKLGHEEGVSLDSKMLSRRITAAQQKNRQYQFMTRRRELLTNVAQERSRQSIETWFEYLQLRAEPREGAFAYDDVSSEFLEWVIERFVQENLSSLIRGKHELSEDNAEQVARLINETLGLSRPDDISEMDIIGHTPASARKVISDRLLDILNNSLRRYWDKRQPSFSEPAGTPEVDQPTVPTEPSRLETYKLVVRTPRATAYWSILSCWIEFQQEVGRIQHRAAARTRSTLEYHRVITDLTLAEAEKWEGFMPPRVLKGLARLDQPELNDELFVYEDNRVYQPSALPEISFDWTEPVDRLSEAPTAGDDPRRLVQKFVSQNVESIKGKVTKEQLIRMLDDFLRNHPLHVLQNPTQIQRALKSVISDQVDAGVSEERRAANKKWLRLFLIFLREQRLIGPLPTLQHRLQSAFAQLGTNVSETKTALTISILVSFLAAFALVANFGKFADPKHFDAFGSVVDALLFGGLLAAGAVNAPAFGVLIIAAILVGVIFPSQISSVKGLGSEVLVVLVLQFAFAFWLTAWPNSLNARGLITAVGIFLTILLVARITQKLDWWLENDSGISLTSAWLSYCVLFALIPLAFSPYAGANRLFVGFAAAVVVFYITQQFNKSEIELISTRLLKSERSMGVEEVMSSRTVEGNCGAGPHIYAIILAWISYQSLNWLAPAETLASNRLFFFLPAAVYLLVTIALTSSILYKRFLPQSWAVDLNVKRQTISGVTNSESLRATLNAHRNKLLLREIGAQGLVIIPLVVIFAEYKLLNTGFPLAIVVVFAACLFGEQSWKFAAQLYRVIFSRVPYSNEPLDLSKIVVANDQPSFQTRIKRFVEDWIGAIITIGVTLIEGIDFIRQAWRFIWSSAGQ